MEKKGIMGASSAGRNDPCPCGSGKKHKKCCWGKSQAQPLPAGLAFESDVDQLSNAALDAIEAGRFEEAEKLCRRLLQEYPDQLDGNQRLGRLREEQGRFKEAAEHYARVLERIKREPESFDEETVSYFEKRRQRALNKAKS